MLTGMFRDRESTEQAYNTLHERGYTKDDINLVMSDETRKKHFSGDAKDTEITGGVIGALVGSGIPEGRARLYESGVKNGNIVMGVRPRNNEDAKYFEDEWRANKGEEIYSDTVEEEEKENFVR